MKRILTAALVALLLAGGVVWSKRQQLLVHAAVRGDIALLEGFLAIGADPNSSVTGSTPLYAAVWHHRLDAAASLIARGADVNAVDVSGVTPLVTAARNGDDALVRLLLAHGADADHRSSCGTPVEVARANHHASTAALLASAPRPRPTNR